MKKRLIWTIICIYLSFASSKFVDLEDLSFKAENEKRQVVETPPPETPPPETQPPEIRPPETPPPETPPPETPPPETPPPETPPPETPPPETPPPETPPPETPPPEVMEEVLVYAGCFNDDYYDRAFPLLFKNVRNEIDWHDPAWARKVLDKCAKEAKKMGYYEFGVQFYGECWSGPATEYQFRKHGKTDRCLKGLGRSWTNAVYRYEMRPKVNGNGPN